MLIHLKERELRPENLKEKINSCYLHACVCK
jgi:hypothetical protein